jgi:hypothetical protein
MSRLIRRFGQLIGGDWLYGVSAPGAEFIQRAELTEMELDGKALTVTETLPTADFSVPELVSRLIDCAATDAA